MAIAFWVLPLRIFSYSLEHTPLEVVLLQGLNGIGAPIYGVAVGAFSAALTKGKGGFNTLTGLFATVWRWASWPGRSCGDSSSSTLTFRLRFTPSRRSPH